MNALKLPIRWAKLLLGEEKYRKVRSSLLTVLSKRKPYKEYQDHEIKSLLDLASAYCGGFRGKRVLDVGDHTGYMVQKVSTDYGAKEAVCIDLQAQNTELLPGCRIERADIRKTDYGDNYFDVIITNSTFEHLHNLDVAFTEMRRILKPGGMLYSHFGPIWSTPWGHHLWVDHQGSSYTYWNVILPVYCHLLMSPEELLAYCLPIYGKEVSEKMVEFVYHSPLQNQLMFEEYENITRQSGFKILFFKGVDEAPELANKYHSQISPEIIEKLIIKFPGCSSFMYAGITMLLKKPG
jgi:ubiquinone/menaquinone biosynthesis C-methylase UbiE